MISKQKNMTMRICLSFVLLVLAYLINHKVISLVLFGCAYILIGFDVLKKSFENILNIHFFDENFLMSIATIGAIVLGEYGEAVFVMLFYQIGELFQSIALGKSRKSISQLMAMAPEYATIERDGKEYEVDPEELKVGEYIIVRPGEKIPVDGIVINGSSNVDTSNLTGESIPRHTKEGDAVISGCINLSGVLKVRVEKEYSMSTVSKILDMVENAIEKKAVSENFISKFARYYTPIVVLCAVIIGLILPIFIGDFQLWFHRALMFLVISCPCALVISVPLAFFGGIGGASKVGILIKGSNFIETLSKCRTMVFDKTGTLTKGKFSVSKIVEVSAKADEILEIAAHGEFYSNHPIAKSVVLAYQNEINEERVCNLAELPGKGMSFALDGDEILIGNKTALTELNINSTDYNDAGTTIYVTKNRLLLGTISINDEIKKEAKNSLLELRKMGVKHQIMLSGDKKDAAESVGRELSLNEICSELLPDEKVLHLERLISEKPQKTTLAYVGDGVNDAPVLSLSDVGIAMGALGSDAAIEAADIVIMDDDLRKLPLAIRLSKRTMSIVKENIIIAIGIKILVMILGVFGVSSMWEAVFADVGVSVIAILNSMRSLNVKDKS